ncbi:DUF5004 domain-containing protein [Tamlana sp. I1]|uniref:DUF5004 domain-containing protein n=1 Tax=Tamlana sp. I1 TaxID=2762061 RepID=UPI00188F242F|nr:DUF5004 domain-containing protein [Tamlana sp. I1]
MNKSILVVKNLLALLVLSVFLVNCNSNDDNDIVCEEELTGELTEHETEFAGTWTLAGIVTEDEIDLTDDDTDNPSTDIYSQYDECQQDAVYTFKADRDYTFTQGKNAEDCEEEHEANGTWKLTEENILINVANCFATETNLEFNEDNTEFSVVGTVTFTDVNDEKITTETTTTYKKVVEAEEEEEDDTEA